MPLNDWKNRFVSSLNLDGKDRELIRLCFRESIAASEVADYFNGVIFEESQYDVCCLIAHMCSKHQYAGAPESLIPTIRGLVRYLTTMNALRIVELFKFIKEINKAGIPVMLTKGAAIRVGYYPKTVRYMADTDVHVAEKDFDRIVKLAKDYGCTGVSDFHSIDMKKGPLAVDIHKLFVKEMQNGAKADGIWRRAANTVQNGVSFYIPSREDMVVQILVSAFYNVFESARDKEKKHIKWVIDILPFLLDTEEKINWKKVARIAEELKIAEQVKVMIFALGDVLPQSVDPKTVTGCFHTGDISPKALRLFADFYNLQSSPCDHLDTSTSIPDVILFWARNIWIKSLYFSGYGNWRRAAINYPLFCVIALRIGNAKEIPGEMIRRISRRARAKRRR